MTNLRDRDGKIVSTRVLAIISSSCIFLPRTREICRFFPGNGDPCRFENFFSFRKKEKFSNGTILKMNKIGFRIYLKGWIIYIYLIMIYHGRDGKWDFYVIYRLSLMRFAQPH